MKIKNQKSLPVRQAGKIKNDIRMVDITSKENTKREAVVQAEIVLGAQTLELIQKNKIPKGDVLITAKIAGIMAAKKTQELIPLCHPLELTNVDINFEFVGKKKILIKSKVSCVGKTGVEMEAFTATAIACLTVYDMCKALDRSITISGIRLLKKIGGKSGVYVRNSK